MEGDRTDTGDFSWQEDPLAGIIPRALHQLFEQLNSMEDCAEFSVRVSFLEIYNEELFDLLGNSLDTQKLRLFEDTAKKVTSFPCSFKIVFSKRLVTRNRSKVWKHGPNWSLFPFFFTMHQNVDILTNSSKDCLWTHIFTFFLFCDYYQFFSFFCQDANRTESNSSIIGCNLSKKHKLTLYQTKSREPNYVDHKILFLLVRQLGNRHPNTIGLASWLMRVFSDFKAMISKSFSVS